MEKFLREWRQDALNKAQYDSAIFIGDKLLALTNDEKDAFWLAQVHFATGNYTRAQTFLAKQDLVSRNVSCRYLAAHCLVKQSRFEEALSVLGDRNPTHLISNASNKRKAQNTAPLGRAIGGHAKGSSRDRQLREEAEEEATNRKYEAAMCYLRGICYAKQNAFDRAKECYKDAVKIDVQCFEAFQQLMNNSLLSPDEEWQFLESLDFDSISVSGDVSSSQEAAEFTKMLYTTRLSKYREPSAFTAACDTLSTHYHLADNPDLLLAKADLLFTQCRYRDALAITDSILQDDKYNFSIHPLHLACLYQLKMKNALFLISHDLADTHPEEPCSWLAVGIYYFSIDKIAEARRYFSKASMMDAHFGPAWIGFAHTFAAEGEHDQAISAYSTAARLFMGTHLPQVFLGMQNHALNNMTLAEEFLKTAYGLCKTDPLLLNEMGIVKYHQDKPQEAVQFFRAALKIAAEIDSDPQAWLSPRTNLAHAYRRLRLWKEAHVEFDEVLRQGGKDPAIFCAKGLIYLEEGRPEKAVVPLHEALAINPQDGIATELLGKALEETSIIDVADGDDLEAFENELDVAKAAGRDRLAQRAGRRRDAKGKAKVSRARAMLMDDEDEKGESMMEMTDDD
ncbi:anaphase-promoting complex subunit cut9 [Colletotrichum kahawae]|uniref:Anaphase-promoting complex subunit cut9 n=1 Tax=Colletotrichum kahawae TaxID=34407 RepID=A0AAD9YCF0_COLKA|nr:anaphase-promoting complex subunit cut9 [Colletotrichum kahawae]